MKKLLSLLLGLCLLFSFSVGAYASASDNAINNDVLLEKLGFTKEELKNLKSYPKEFEPFFQNGNRDKKITKADVLRLANLGFTKQEIADMDSEALDRLKNEKGTLLEVDSKYLKIEDGISIEVPESEALVEIKKQKDKESKKQEKDIYSIAGEIGTDTEQTSWMKMTTSVTSLVSGEFQVKNSFSWLTEPVFVLEDAIGISNPEYMVPVQNSEVQAYTYDRYTNNTSVTYVNYATKYKYTADDKNSNGMAFKYDILGTDNYNGTTYICKNHRGYMYYKFTKASPVYTAGHAYGHYSHSEWAIAGSIGVKISLNSLSVSGATSVTKMTDTGVSFSF